MTKVIKISRNVIFNENSDIFDSYSQETVPVCSGYQDATELGDETDILTMKMKQWMNSKTLMMKKNPITISGLDKIYRSQNSMMLILQKFPEHKNRQVTLMNQRIGRMQ